MTYVTTARSFNEVACRGIPRRLGNLVLNQACLVQKPGGDTEIWFDLRSADVVLRSPEIRAILGDFINPAIWRNIFAVARGGSLFGLLGCIPWNVKIMDAFSVYVRLKGEPQGFGETSGSSGSQSSQGSSGSQSPSGSASSSGSGSSSDSQKPSGGRSSSGSSSNIIDPGWWQ
jgi:hypothetical protein